MKAPAVNGFFRASLLGIHVFDTRNGCLQRMLAQYLKRKFSVSNNSRVIFKYLQRVNHYST